MKLIAILSLLLPVLALAFPAKGDLVKYQAHYQGGVVEVEKSITAFDAQTDLFTVHTLMKYKSEVLSDKYLDLPSSFLYNQAKVENVLITCQSREGAISYVSVMGKIIKACEFYHEDSGMTYMIGMVPFGQVRFQEYLGDGEFLDFNVVEFTSEKTR